MRVTRVLFVALGLFAVMATVAQGEGVARLAPQPQGRKGR
jgi:hypothetical protein